VRAPREAGAVAPLSPRWLVPARQPDCGTTTRQRRMLTSDRPHLGRGACRTIEHRTRRQKRVSRNSLELRRELPALLSPGDSLRQAQPGRSGVHRVGGGS
jgi:hypothetical protein